MCDSVCPYTFHLPKLTIKLDEPEDTEKFYSLKELILQLQNVKGARKIVNSLNRQGRCLFMHTSFETHLKRYRETGILPVGKDLGGQVDKPPLVPFTDITKLLNSKQKENIGYIEDDNVNTERVLLNELRNEATSMNKCTTSSVSRKIGQKQ